MDNSPLLSTHQYHVLKKFRVSMNDLLMVDEEQLGNLRFRNKKCCVAITGKSCYVYQINENKSDIRLLNSFNVDSLTGAHCHRTRSRNEWVLNIYLYIPRPNSCCSSQKENEICRQRHIVTISFHFDDKVNEKICFTWMNCLRTLSIGEIPPSIVINNGEIVGDLQTLDSPRQRKFLVVVNPVSGNGTAMNVWNKVTKPMLEEAAVSYNLVKTTHANHARQMMATMMLEDLRQYEAVLVIGGDGMLFEVVNGISDRVLQLGSGSGSGISSSLESDVSKNCTIESAFSPVLPTSTPPSLSPLLPLSEIQALRELFSPINFAHIPGGTGNGMVKTILFESGHAYSAMNATFVAIKGKPKSVDLTCVQTKSGQRMTSFLALSLGLISDIDILSESMRWMGELRLHLAAVYFIARRRFTKVKLSMKFVDAQKGGYQTIANPTPPSSGTYTSTDSRWDLVLTEELLAVWVTMTSFAASTVCVNPTAKLGAGVVTVFVFQRMSRWEMVQLLLSIDTGDHVNHPKVKKYPCSEYLLEPLTEDGIFALDGERVEHGPIHGGMLAGMANFLSLQ